MSRPCTANHSVGGSINRYYDPTTDQFLSIDPDVATTNQPYVFANDNPLNAEDPTGQCWFACGVWHDATSVADHVGNFVVHHPMAIVLIVVGTAVVIGSAGLGAAIAPMLAAEVVGEEATAFSAAATLAHGAIILGVPFASGVAGVASVLVGVKMAITTPTKKTKKK